MTVKEWSSKEKDDKFYFIQIYYYSMKGRVKRMKTESTTGKKKAFENYTSDKVLISRKPKENPLFPEYIKNSQNSRIRK